MHFRQGDRDAAKRGRKLGRGDMKKYRAAGAASWVGNIIVEDDHQIVQVIGPPKTFVAGRERQTYRTIISTIGWVVAPG